MTSVSSRFRLRSQHALKPIAASVAPTCSDFHAGAVIDLTAALKRSLAEGPAEKDTRPQKALPLGARPPSAGIALACVRRPKKKERATEPATVTEKRRRRLDHAWKVVKAPFLTGRGHDV